MYYCLGVIRFLSKIYWVFKDVLYPLYAELGKYTSVRAKRSYQYYLYAKLIDEVQLAYVYKQIYTDPKHFR